MLFLEKKGLNIKLFLRLVNKMLALDPKKRPSFDSIVKDPFFEGLELWKNYYYKEILDLYKIYTSKQLLNNKINL